MKALTLPALALRALALAAPLAAIACDDTAAPTTTPALATGALTGTVDLTFSVRGIDGVGAGAVRFVDDATGAALGACDGACVVPVPRDARVRLIATPAPGSAFAGWRNVCWGAPADGCVVHVTWHLPAGADFQAAPPPAPTTWDLTLVPESADGLGAGRVRVHDDAGALLGTCGPEAGARCVVPVTRGARVRLVANPERGSVWSAWRNVCWGAGREDCYLDVSWHTSAHVTFAADPERGVPTAERVALRAAEARAYLAPERAAGRILRGLFAPLSPAVSTRGDDDPTPRLDVTLKGDGRRTFELGGRALAEIAAADALRLARDTRHQLRLYRALFAEARLRMTDVVGRHPDPAVIPHDPIVIADAIADLSEHIDQGMAPAEPIGFEPIRERACLEGSPQDEIGTAEGLDLAALTPLQIDACGTSPDGIYQAWDGLPKDGLGCVRDQGARGTCTAFGVVSAIETALHQRYGELYNLSEQHLYAILAGDDWTPEDGASVPGYFEYLAKWPDYVRLEYEDAWQYNQSLDRKVVSIAEYEAQPFPRYWFEDSCLGYYETCTDNVAQCEVVCDDPEPENHWYCNFVCPKLSGPTFRFAWEALELWDADDLDATIIHIRARFSLGHQMVVSMAVPSNFLHPDANGFLGLPADEEILGYHAMHVVALVANPHLAVLLPGAPPGEGGGYFVVRNSWGPCYGDGGYVYIPVAVMRDYAYSMMSFKGTYVEKAP